TGLNLSRDLFEDQAKEGIRTKEKDFWIKYLAPRVVKKVVYKFDFYYFSNLETLDEFITKYLGEIKINIAGLTSQLDQLKPDDEFAVLVKVIGQIAASLTSHNPEFRGSKEFKPYPIKEKISVKQLNFAPNES